MRKEIPIVSLLLLLSVCCHGAGHDAQDIARIAPIGMIFVPSIGGISQSPKEFTTASDMANGASVLLQSILSVDEKGL